MSILRGLSFLRASLRAFPGDRRGNIAILFGLMLVPLTGAVALAVDYSFANQARTRMQAALDITAITLSKLMPLSQSDLDSKGRQIFLANLGKTPLTVDASSIANQLTITPSSSGISKILLSVNTEYPIRMAGVLGPLIPPEIPVSAKTEVQWGNTRLRVALVLDNSLSMDESGKMAALKTATTNLLTTLQNVAKDPEDVYVSIVPFSFNVDVNKTNYTHSEWIDFTAWDQSHGSCTVSGKTTQSSCQSAHACSKNPGTNNTQTKCTNAGGTWNAGVWTPADHSTWNGCVTDRGVSSSSPDTPQGLDQSIAVPTGGTTRWPADPDDSHTCPTAITPLTNTWTTLSAAVTALDTAYSTNQPIGLVWGWQSLRGGGPMGAMPAKDPNFVYSDTIILMSDGLNTMNRWNLTMPGNTHVSVTSVDKRMYDSNGTTGTCKYVKDDNIQIFTVQVNTGGDDTSTLLKNCATNPSMFFEMTTANELITTFDAIGSALANIHLSQ